MLLMRQIRLKLSMTFIDVYQHCQTEYGRVAYFIISTDENKNLSSE